MSDSGSREDLTHAQRALIALRNLRRKHESLKEEHAALRVRQHEPIAIVGMGCRYPGGVRTPEDYWSLLASGGDAITDVPDDRWDADAFYDEDAGAPGKTYSVEGGFLDRVDTFDAGLFGLSADEAEAMDPQQRLLLEVAWEALERAGIPPRTDAGHERSTGVFVGLSTHDYSKRHIDAPDPSRIGPYAFTGSAFSVASGRIAYLLGLQGPTLTVDTACSSSLVSTHLACNSLRNGECDAALAGGANVLVGPENFIYFSKTNALSRSGRCRTFDANADGYVRAEGCGVLVLKRLSDAQADGDPVRAVIRGSAVNHDGQSNGLTAPNGVSQRRVLRDALDDARLDGAALDYVEAHGTGTPLGDPIEVAALSDVLRDGRASDAPPTRIGSCKTNVGHMEAAAGVGGLMKAALALRHGHIPPSLHFDTPNDRIDWDDAPVSVPQSLESWPGPTSPRHAGVSAFGFSGTNAHVVLEEPPAVEDRAVPVAGSPHPSAASLVVLSAQDDERLRAMASNLRDFVVASGGDDAVTLPNVAYTLQVGRTALDARLALDGPSLDALVAALDAFLDDAPAPDGTTRATGTVTGPPDAPPLAEGDPATVAEAWTDGRPVDWDAFHDAHSGPAPRRIPLPTYPFRETRYWLDAPTPTTSPDLSDAASQSESDADGSVPNDAPDDVVDFVQTKAASLSNQDVEAVAEAPNLRSLNLGSIALLQLRYALQSTFGATISTSALVDSASWDALADQVEPAGDGSSGAPDQAAGTSSADADALPGDPTRTLTPNPDRRHEPFPLTDLQESFLAGKYMAPSDERVGGHVYLEIERDTVDADRLERAWNRLVDYHDMLRAEIRSSEEQVIHASVPHYDVDVHALGDASDAAFDAHLDAVRDRLSHAVYDADTWPLFTVEVTRSDAHPDRIHLSIDEWIFDGYSLSMLLEQWETLYHTPDADLPPLDLSFRDYVVALDAQTGTPAFQEQVDYWRAKGDAVEPGPALAYSDGSTGRRRERLDASLDAASWQRLKDRADAHGVTPTALLLTVFAAVLHDASDDECAFSLILTFFNRLPLHPQVEQILGPALSTMLYVAEASPSNLESRVRQYQRQLWDDLDHAAVSSVRAIRELKRQGDLSPSFQVPVVFTSMLDNFGPDDGGEGWSYDWAYGISQTPQVWLDHQVYERDGALEYHWDVAPGAFEDDAVHDLFARYRRTLHRLAAPDADLDRPVHDVVASTSPPRIESETSAVRETSANPETSAESNRVLTPAPPSDPDAPFPLTDVQVAYSYSRYTDDDLGGCVVHQSAHVDTFDRGRLDAVWEALVDTHGMLRAVVRDDGTQRILPANAVDATSWVESETVSDAQFDAAVDATRDRLIHRVYPLGEAPLHTLAVTRSDAGRAAIHFASDMLVADGRSQYFLFDELLRGYVASPDVVHAPSASFKQYVEATQTLPDDRVDAAQTYWREKFARIVPGPSLPTASHAPDAPGAADRRQVRLTSTVPNADRLRSMSRDADLPLPSVLLALYAEVVAMWSERDAFGLVVPDFDRPGDAWDGIVGDFSNLSWVERIPETMPFLEKARRMHETLQADKARHPVSGLQALRRATRRRDGVNLDFPVVFTHHDFAVDAPQDAGIRHGGGLSRTPGVRVDGSATLQDDAVHLHWDVAAHTFPDGVPQAMFDAFTRGVAYLSEDRQHWTALDVHPEIEALRPDTDGA